MTQFFRKIYLSLYLKGFERVTQRFYGERKLETEKNCNMLTLTLRAITAFLSRSMGCSTRGLGARSSGCWFSLPHLISNGLNFLCTELYNYLTSNFFLLASQIALIQPVHGQGYNLIFLDRMHLLFRFPILTARPGRRSIYNTMTQRLH